MSIFTPEMEAKADARRAAAATCLVPVMDRYARGFPEHQNCPNCGHCDPRKHGELWEGDLCGYVPLGNALTKRFPMDAHFCAYSAPNVPNRRLAGQAALAYAPQMILFVVDVEPAGHAKVTDAWWQDQVRRLEVAISHYPGAHVYRTRGGYRIVWRLRDPFELRTHADAVRWRHTYLGWLTILNQRFGIVGDTNCADWTRLYRLPFVLRDGQPQEPLAAFGDPYAIGFWSEPFAPPVVETPREAAPIALAVPVNEPDMLEAIEALARSWPRMGTRHAASRALAGALAKSGWDVDAIAEFMTAVSGRAAELSGQGDPSGEYSKRREFAERTVAMLQRGENIEGWPVLVTHVGETAVGHARGKLGLAVAPEPELWNALAPPVVDPVLDMVRQRQNEPAPMNDLQLVQAALANAAAREAAGGTAVDVAMLLEDIGRQKKPPIRTYPTANVELNARIGGGLKTRQLLVLTAPPGDGKSALAVDWSIDMESKQGRSVPTPAFPEGYDLSLPILYFSTELEAEELLARFAANVLDKPDASWTKIVAGEVEPGIVDAAIAGRRIRVVGADRLPMDGAEALRMVVEQIAWMIAKYGTPPMVVIDYMQDLVRHGGDDTDAKRLLGTLASKLRTIAQHFDCVLVAVSSVSRSYYGIEKAEKMRKGKDARIYLAAAKESGDVDYAAATVIFLDVGDRSEPADGMPAKPGRPARIAIAKCRHGDPGFVGARFFGASGRWTADPGALDEVLEGNTGASAVRTETQMRKDAEAIVEHVRRQSTPMTRTQAAEGIPGWGKPRGKAAVDKAIELGLVIAMHITRLEGGRPKDRECLFIPGTEPKVTTTADLPPPSPPDPALAGWAGVAMLSSRNP